MLRPLALASLALFALNAPATAASSVELAEIRGYAPHADLSTLSDLQINTLLDIIHTQGGEGRAGAHVRAYLLQAQGDSLLQKLLR